MAGEKHRIAAGNLPEQQRGRGLAVRGTNDLAMGDGERR
jgi:hypothetical protein